MDIAPPTDPIAAVTHPDPYPYYAGLARVEHPAWNAGLEMWIVVNPAHVAQILRHPDARVVAPADTRNYARRSSSASPAWSSTIRRSRPPISMRSP